MKLAMTEARRLSRFLLGLAALLLVGGGALLVARTAPAREGWLAAARA